MELIEGIIKSRIFHKRLPGIIMIVIMLLAYKFPTVNTWFWGQMSRFEQSRIQSSTDGLKSSLKTLAPAEAERPAAAGHGSTAADPGAAAPVQPLVLPSPNAVHGH